jgi:3-oxoacyl-[acyl-carrier protein] reductase
VVSATFLTQSRISSSVVRDTPAPISVTSSLAKAGAVSLTKTLGQAFAAQGIRVNGIAPGLVDTKLTKVTTDHPERLEGALASIPLRRLGTPADMAGAALFLASPLAAYITGQTIVVDGGLTL